MRYRVYDLWQKTTITHSNVDQSYVSNDNKEAMVWGKDLGTYANMLPHVKVNAHSVKAFKLIPDANEDMTALNTNVWHEL